MKEIKRGDTEFALSLRNAINELLEDKEGFNDLFEILGSCIWVWGTKNKAPSGD